MDNLRVFLWAGLAMMIWLSYASWQRQFPPPAAPGPDAAAIAPQETAGSDLPALPQPPEQPAIADAAPDLPALPGQQPAAADTSDQLITVRTDVLELQIDLRGGDIANARCSTIR